ncbi:MAG: efflux RND transporter periplasmic adaptor subunit [Bacteroidetes bacterium]|nr:efflux RND transporter periplasmic adaptor subunit [Bacteroidota bacterium]
MTASFTSPAQSNAVLTASGYVVAQRKAAVASKGTGRLISLGVVEGDRVRKDQVIARLEDNDIRAQLDQARANLKLNEAELVDARQTLVRVRSLFEKGLASQAELDAAQARHDRVLAGIDVAKAQVSGAEVALENMLIRAPFDGTVLTKNADVGEIVAPFAASASSRAAVVTIADMSSLQVEADVSESNIERIAPDQPTEITLDAYPEKRYQGYVAKIVPTADRAKATVMVKVGFVSYDTRVLPEMSAKVLFLTQASRAQDLEQKPVLTVASTAVVERDGRAFVFKVSDKRAVEVPVQLGRTFGAFREITSGLTSGEKVVDKPSDAIVDGVSVIVK